MSKREEVLQHQKVATVKLTEVTIRYDALLKLYDAASFMDNRIEIDKIRQELHALLDAKLDHSTRIMQLARDMLQLP